MPKKSKPDIDLTNESDTAVEHPLPMVPPNLIPPTTTNSVFSAPGQMSTAQNVVNLLQCCRNALVSSPSITTQGYTRSIIVNDNLARAPIKSQCHQQQSSGRDDMAGLPSNSWGKSHQPSFLTNRTEGSFAPSMASSLPSVPNKAPSVPKSPPKRNSMESSHRSDIMRLPHGLSRPPGSLLADAYSPSGFYSSPTRTKTSSGRNSHDGASGRRGSGCQRNALDERKAEPVVVIDEDEGEHAQDNSRHQMRSNETSRESRKVPPDSSKQVADGKREDRDSGVSLEHQKKADCIMSPLQEKIPSLQNLKAHPLRSPLKLKRLGNKEREDTKTAPAAPVYVSAGEPTGRAGR